MSYDESIDVADIVHRKAGKFCRHLLMDVVAEQRTVKCRRCGALLDPFEAMLTLTGVADRYAHAVREHRRINNDVESLKAEEKRLKARIARLKKNPLSKEPTPQETSDALRVALDSIEKLIKERDALKSRNATLQLCVLAMDDD